MALNEEHQNTEETWHSLLKEVFLLGKTLEHAMGKVHEETGLTSLQRQILRQLILKGEATIPEIAREREVSRQSSQVIINEMLRREIVERKENPKHKSSYLISVTDRGRLQLEKARKQEDTILAEKLCDVNPAGIDDATDLLRRIRVVMAKEM